MGRLERDVAHGARVRRMSATGAVGLLAFTIAACGPATGGVPRPTPSAPPSAAASPSASAPASLIPTSASVCSANAPVPGCTELGDPTAPASCHTTQGVQLSVPSSPEDKLPSYGFGAGPVYLSGQLQWYAGGEEALFLINSSYSGIVRVTGQLAGNATAVPSFTGTNANGTEIDIPAGSESPSWRFWDGQMAFTTGGCYTLHLKTDAANESVTIYVHHGAAPPG